MTPERRAELKRLEKAATPGPWLVTGDTTFYAVTENGGHNRFWATIQSVKRAEYGEASKTECEADAAFIAAAREAVPELLREVERLEARNEALRCERDGAYESRNSYRDECRDLKAEVEKVELSAVDSMVRAQKAEERVAELEGAVALLLDTGRMAALEQALRDMPHSCTTEPDALCGGCLARAALAGKEAKP